MTGIRAARPGEAAALTALALRSKAHWGYDEAFMAAAAAELRWDESDLRGLIVRVAERDGALAGFCAVDPAADPPELEALFVDPPAMGQGVGATLLTAAREAARARGIEQLAIESDPGAEGFYRAHGARRVGARRSPSTGRLLPHLVVPT